MLKMTIQPDCWSCNAVSSAPSRETVDGFCTKRSPPDIFNFETRYTDDCTVTFSGNSSAYRYREMLRLSAISKYILSPQESTSFMSSDDHVETGLSLFNPRAYSELVMHCFPLEGRENLASPWWKSPRAYKRTKKSSTVFEAECRNGWMYEGI